MKRAAVLILAFFLLLSSTVAFAENHPTPPVSTFAEMRVKTSDTAYSIALSKPVDLLFINWTDGSGLQELLVDEDLRAYAFRAGHKYLAGIQERVSTARSTEIYDGKELIYRDIQLDPITGYEIVREVKTYVRKQVLKHDKDLEKNILEFEKRYGGDYHIELIEPEQVFAEAQDRNGNTVKVPVKDENGDDVYLDGEIKAYTLEIKYNSKESRRKTNVATPDQVAFVTLQEDEWVVCYNRSGQIVKIEYYEGQF